MANEEFDFDALRDLLEGASLVGNIAQDKKTFRSAYGAFRAGNTSDFQTVLKRLGLFSNCSLVCDWIRINECIFLCRDLCGFPKSIDHVPNVRVLAVTIANITSDDKLLKELAHAFEERNCSAFKEIVARYKLGPLSHFFCLWLCATRYRLICQALCSLQQSDRPEFFLALQSAGHSLRQLLAHGDSFNQAVAAWTARDPSRLRKILGNTVTGTIPFCFLICEWLCSWRCTLVCIALRPEVPFHPVMDEIDEALAFAKVIRSFPQNPGVVRRLVVAVAGADSSAWVDVLGEFKLQRLTASVNKRAVDVFSIQLCYWACTMLYRRFFVSVFQPSSHYSWFTHVGDVSIAADIDLGSGLTNKAESGRDGRFRSIELGRFRPQADPAHRGEPMADRILYRTPLRGSANYRGLRVRAGREPASTFYVP